MICPRCSTPNRASAKFCDECGYELPSVAPIANEMFDDEQHSKTCKPKSAPTADLNGVDKTNDSSFEEVSNLSDTTDISNDITDVMTPLCVKNVQESSFEGSRDDENVYKTAKIEDVPQDTRLSDFYDEDFHNQKTARLDIADYDNNIAKQKIYSVESQKQKKRTDTSTKRNVLIALGTIAVVAVLLSVTYIAQIWGGKVIPDVMSLPEADAKAQLEAAGFKVQIEQVPSDEVEGIVVNMNPAANSRVSDGSTIYLDISMRRVIPNIVGMNLDDAKRVMDKNGFTNVEYKTQKSDDEENIVLSVSPEVDSRASANANVVVVVSQSYTVPDVSGLSIEEATSRVKEAGFNAKIEEVYDDSKTENLAISTNPEKETKLKSGSDVTIQICVHRSTKLVELTREFFSQTNNFVINSKDYELGSLVAVEWTSNGNVAYTITARQYQITNWFGDNVETRYLDYETIQGSISFDDNNNIIATNPAIRQA